MVNVFDRQIQLVFVMLAMATIFGSPIGKNPEQTNVRLQILAEPHATHTGKRNEQPAVREFIRHSDLAVAAIEKPAYGGFPELFPTQPLICFKVT